MQNSPQSPKLFTATPHDGYVHEYAKGGMAGATLINGGAAVTVISQLARFEDMDMGISVAISMTFWTLGLIAAVVAWVIALGSSRYVSRAQQKNSNEQQELVQSDFLMLWGISSVVASIALFSFGVFILIGGFITQRQLDDSLVNYAFIAGTILFGIFLYYLITKQFTKRAENRTK